MKYKVLLIGNNKGIIREFFTYMDYDFECLSTSEHYDDIMGHIKYVHPDVIVYCLLQEKPDDIKRFINIAGKISSSRIPFVIIGDAVDCNDFLSMGAELEPLVLQKPIASQNIVTAITDMMRKREMIRQQLQKTSEAENTAASPAAADLSAEEKTDRKKHILIVDDDSRMLRLLKSYLAERYELAMAINGSIALKFLETKETDLVLLDYEMPTENGASVLEKIRANEKTKDLPVVFLTGVTERNKIQEVLELKPQGYLLKPIDMNKLSSTIKGILD